MSVLRSCTIGGMYDTLRPELITATEKQRELMRRDPTYVVEKDMFLANQFPYLEVGAPASVCAKTKFCSRMKGVSCHALPMNCARFGDRLS